jgi:hypothetical protein
MRNVVGPLDPVIWTDFHPSPRLVDTAKDEQEYIDSYWMIREDTGNLKSKH